MSADHCKNAAAVFERALQVERSGNQALAILLQKSSEQYQASGRCWDQSAQAAVLKYTCLKQPLEAAFWDNKGAHYQSAAASYQQAAEAYAQGKGSEGDRLCEVANATLEAAKALQKPSKKGD